MDKQCKWCGKVKPLEDFYRHDGCRDGRRPECTACNLAEKAKRHAENPEPARQRTREWHSVPENRERTKERHQQYREDGRKALSNRRGYLKRTYGITLEEYDAKLAAQDGRCAICRREPRPDISLHVDHNHGSGEIRGLLCFSCNVTVGHIREDRDRLRAIGTYLDRHDPEWVAWRDAALARISEAPRGVWKQVAVLPLASGAHEHSALRTG